MFSTVLFGAGSTRHCPFDVRLLTDRSSCSPYTKGVWSSSGTDHPRKVLRASVRLYGRLWAPKGWADVTPVSAQIVVEPTRLPSVETPRGMPPSISRWSVLPGLSSRRALTGPGSTSPVDLLLVFIYPGERYPGAVGDTCPTRTPEWPLHVTLSLNTFVLGLWFHRVVYNPDDELEVRIRVLRWS